MSVYICGGAMHSALGSSLGESVNALKKMPPRLDEVTTEVTGDDNTEKTVIPYRLLSGEMPLYDDSRSYTVIESVIDQAISDADLSADDLVNTALFCGSSSFLIGDKERDFQKELLEDKDSAVPFRKSGFGGITRYLCQRFSIGGEEFNFNTACTASANALLYAERMISAGTCQHAIVLGFEFFNETTMLGFHNLELLSREGMRPFDHRRDGLELGEACAALVLSETHQGDFQFLGGANLCDTYSISSANPDGSTVHKVMSQAIRNTGVKKKDITAIKCHGTASLLNDETESTGMTAFFEDTFDSGMPIVCALKPYLGHTLGACGITELLLFCGAVKAGFLPAALSGFEKDKSLNVTLNESLDEGLFEKSQGYFMLNYFGFGGNNTSILISGV